VTVRRVVAIVPARDEADRVGSTVRALASVPGVSTVVVADDASTDGTGGEARAAGARVIRAGRRLGKGGILEGALRRVDGADVWLFADADLGDSARRLGEVLRRVMAGDADLAIAILPSGAGDGLGTIRRLAAAGIRRSTGFVARAPLSGQRAITSAALAACRPLAAGYGVEAAMTVDAVRAGARIVEVPVDLSHRRTGRGPRGFAHRGRQGIDIAAALAARAGGGR
jgi:glycosyltransferase involved in cell wall biosynthesis